HVVRGRQRDFSAAHRLADRSDRPGAALYGVDHSVRDLVVDVRTGADATVPARVARVPGRRRGPDDSAVADLAAGELSARKSAAGAVDVGDDDADRAGRRPDSRRLDLGQYLVAVDLLREYSGWRARGGRHVGDLSRPRFGDQESADRHGRPRAA